MHVKQQLITYCCALWFQNSRKKFSLVAVLETPPRARDSCNVMFPDTGTQLLPCNLLARNLHRYPPNLMPCELHTQLPYNTSQFHRHQWPLVIKGTRQG